MLPRLNPMLCSPGDVGFHRDGWITEIKYDGLRVLAYREDGRVRLIGRAGNDLTRRFPKIVKAILNIPGDNHILDGELVTFDPDGVSKLYLVAAHGREADAMFVMFDAPFLDGEDLRFKPLSARREMLEEKYNAAFGPSLGIAWRLDANGKAFDQAQQQGLEGIVAKDPSSFYTEDRSSRWIKVKAVEQDVFTVVGYTKSDKRGFSALMVAEGGKYRGREWGHTGNRATHDRLSSPRTPIRSRVRK